MPQRAVILGILLTLPGTMVARCHAQAATTAKKLRPSARLIDRKQIIPWIEVNRSRMPMSKIDSNARGEEGRTLLLDTV